MKHFQNIFNVEITIFHEKQANEITHNTRFMTGAGIQTFLIYPSLGQRPIILTTSLDTVTS